jgi:hypothetical protein
MLTAKILAPVAIIILLIGGIIVRTTGPEEEEMSDISYFPIAERASEDFEGSPDYDDFFSDSRSPLTMDSNGLSDVETVFPFSSGAFQSPGFSQSAREIRERQQVSQKPTVDLKINGSDWPVVISSGDSVTLSWTASNVAFCFASGWWSGNKPVDGTETIDNITDPQNFTIKCSSPKGSVSDSISVTVKISEEDGQVAGIAPSSTTTADVAIAPTGAPGYAPGKGISFYGKSFLGSSATTTDDDDTAAEKITGGKGFGGRVSWMWSCYGVWFVDWIPGGHTAVFVEGENGGIFIWIHGKSRVSNQGMGFVSQFTPVWGTYAFDTWILGEYGDLANCPAFGRQRVINYAEISSY